MVYASKRRGGPDQVEWASVKKLASQRRGSPDQREWS